jgi:hypothetical protein
MAKRFADFAQANFIDIFLVIFLPELEQRTGAIDVTSVPHIAVAIIEDEFPTLVVVQRAGDDFASIAFVKFERIQLWPLSVQVRPRYALARERGPIGEKNYKKAQANAGAANQHKGRWQITEEVVAACDARGHDAYSAVRHPNKPRRAAIHILRRLRLRDGSGTTNHYWKHTTWEHGRIFHLKNTSILNGKSSSWKILLLREIIT